MNAMLCYYGQRDRLSIHKTATGYELRLHGHRVYASDDLGTVLACADEADTRANWL